jgi:Calcineurin-like phosphoesterase
MSVFLYTIILMKKKKVKRKKHGSHISRRKNAPEIIVLGDIHGEYGSLKEILVRAGIIDTKEEWVGKNKILVQVGDVIDRGPESEEANAMLTKLQLRAEEHKGKVIRLLGNHELELLKGNFFLVTIHPSRVLQFREQLVKSILSSKIVAAYVAGKYIITHAGITGELLDILRKEVGSPRAGIRKIANHINKILVKSVKNKDYSHPIFNVGPSRGGTDVFGGIFWEDIRDLSVSQKALKIKQIVGHTPLRKVSIFAKGNLIGVDIGLFKGYGGGKSYLKIKNGLYEVVDLKRK